MPTLYLPMRSLSKLLALFSLVIASLAPLLIPQVSAKGTTQADLEQAVVNAMLAHKGASVAEVGALKERSQVNLKRTDASGAWTFGAAVIMAPPVEHAIPDGWLFVAQATKQGWVVGLEGSPTFHRLVKAAPPSVVADHEKAVFATAEVGTQATNPGLRLPWSYGVSWYWTGGAHGTNYNSLDFAGGDQVVRASRAGNVYTMCSNNLGWLRIYHNNGYATDYYHLWNNIKLADGTSIALGARLGDTGTDVSCGGSATGRHVHFGLFYNGSHVTVDDKIIGMWTFQRGSSPYQGYATKVAATRYPGSLLYNYGP